MHQSADMPPVAANTNRGAARASNVIELSDADRILTRQIMSKLETCPMRLDALLRELQCGGRKADAETIRKIVAMVWNRLVHNNCLMV